MRRANMRARARQRALTAPQIHTLLAMRLNAHHAQQGNIRTQRPRAALVTQIAHRKTTLTLFLNALMGSKQKHTDGFLLLHV